MIDLCKSSHIAWLDVAEKVKKSVVFMDNVCAESLHWNGGALLLFNSGASDVKQFSSFECGKAEERKAVFVISGPLQGTNLNILHDILEASSFQYVIVISSLSPAMHTIVNHGRGEDEMKTFVEVEEQLLEWMGNMNYTAEIVHVPVVTAPITSQLFVLPEHSHVFPMLPSDLDILLPAVMKEHKGQGTIGDLDYGHLPKDLQLSYKLLVCCLNSFLDTVGVCEDVYGLGHTSRIVASELASLPWAKHRRKKNAQKKASLLLVDRTLDLANVVGHHWDTLLDRILALLPNLPGHKTDVCVNMVPICSVRSDCSAGVIAPGCLAHPEDESSCNVLHALANNKYKESLMEVNRQLVEAACNDNVPIKLSGRPGRVTADQLDSHLSQFRSKTKVIRKNAGLLQLVLAVLQTLRHKDNSHVDSLLGLEKGLLQCMGDEESPTPLLQVTKLLEKERDLPPEKRSYTLEDIFLLVMFVYVLVDEAEDVELLTEQNKIMDILVKLIMEESDELPDFLVALMGECPQRETVVLVIQDMFQKLGCLSRTREDLQDFSNIYEPGSMTSQACLTPLIRTVMETVFDPSKPEIPDIIYKSTGFRDLLKSGFGLFMNVSKPRPSDHPLLIVFIIGGTTATEARQIREAVNSSKTNIQVIVGSTSLLSPKDLLNQVLVADQLHPKVS